MIKKKKIESTRRPLHWLFETFVYVYTTEVESIERFNITLQHTDKKLHGERSGEHEGPVNITSVGDHFTWEQPSYCHHRSVNCSSILFETTLYHNLWSATQFKDKEFTNAHLVGTNTLHHTKFHHFRPQCYLKQRRLVKFLGNVLWPITTVLIADTSIQVKCASELRFHSLQFVTLWHNSLLTKSRGDSSWARMEV